MRVTKMHLGEGLNIVYYEDWMSRLSVNDEESLSFTLVIRFISIYMIHSSYDEIVLLEKFLCLVKC